VNKGFFKFGGCDCPGCKLPTEFKAYAIEGKGMKGNKFPSWCCQECGEPIGWLGRFFSYVLPFRPFKHVCKSDPYHDSNNWGV
jgi:hypothetical protein